MQRRSRLIALCLAANLVIVIPVAAQTAPGSTAAAPSTSAVRDDDIAATVRLPLFNRTHPPLDRFAVDPTSSTFRQQRVRSRDSLANGAVIGAVIGAATFGAFAAALCKAYQEEGGASCLPDTFRFAAIGGAIGAGVGLAIDSARNDRGVSVRIAIRF